MQSIFQKMPIFTFSLSTRKKILSVNCTQVWTTALQKVGKPRCIAAYTGPFWGYFKERYQFSWPNGRLLRMGRLIFLKAIHKRTDKRNFKKRFGIPVIHYLL